MDDDSFHGKVLESTKSSNGLNSKYNDTCNQETPAVGNENYQNQKSYICDICSLPFFRLAHLKDHQNCHSNIRSYQCKENLCSKAYFAWKHLRKHLIGSHKLENVTKSSYVGREDYKRFKCIYEGCNASFDRPWKLISHTSIHTGEKLYSCAEQGCNKAYSKMGHLRRHIANSHTPKLIVKEYLCSEAGCEKVYRSLESLRRHYTSHSKNEKLKEPPLKCTSCYGEFASTSHLASHRCAFKCRDCNLEFISLSAWKNHLKLHQTFKCDMPSCDEVFPQYSLLKEHKRLQHKQSFRSDAHNKKFSSESTRKIRQQTHLISDKKFFPCSYNECSSFYTTKYNLQQHIRNKHKDVKFECSVPGCKKKLATKQKLEQHIKLHYPLHESRPKKQLARRQRKDAGKPKRSMAVKLSGLKVPYPEEKLILQIDVNNHVNKVNSEL